MGRKAGLLTGDFDYSTRRLIFKPRENEVRSAAKKAAILLFLSIAPAAEREHNITFGRLFAAFLSGLNLASLKIHGHIPM